MDRLVSGRKRQRPPAPRIRVCPRGITCEVGLHAGAYRMRGTIADGWRNAVEPRALVGCTRARKGGARELLRI
eukprot:scaffold113416_cov28-Tisochrysis_lutea.AAC.1